MPARELSVRGSGSLRLRVGAVARLGSAFGVGRASGDVALVGLEVDWVGVWSAADVLVERVDCGGFLVGELEVEEVRRGGRLVVRVGGVGDRGVFTAGGGGGTLF